MLTTYAGKENILFSHSSNSYNIFLLTTADMFILKCVRKLIRKVTLEDIVKKTC